MEKYELQQIINLNNLEFLMMVKEYLPIYIKSLLCDNNLKNNRKVLLQKLNEYKYIIKQENAYMKYIKNNFLELKNVASLNEVLGKLDILNEKTYCYYDSVLKEFEENSNNIVPLKSFKTLLETREYESEVKGLFLTDKDLEYYYQKEDAYYYLKEHTKIIDVDLERGLDFYGCYPTVVGNVLQKINICVPPITDLKSMLINIHEYRHGIDLFSYLGKKVPEIDYEVIAKAEEDRFVKKYLLKK